MSPLYFIIFIQLCKTLVSASHGHSCSQPSNSNSPSADYRLSTADLSDVFLLLMLFNLPQQWDILWAKTKLRQMLGSLGGPLNLTISALKGAFLLSWSFTAAFGDLDARRLSGRDISGHRNHKQLQQIDMPRRSCRSIEAPSTHLLHPSCFMSMVWRVRAAWKETCDHDKTTAALLNWANKGRIILNGLTEPIEWCLTETPRMYEVQSSTTSKRMKPMSSQTLISVLRVSSKPRKIEVWFPAHSQFHLDVNQEHAALLHQVDDKHDEPRHLHQSSHPKKIVDSEDPPVCEMFHLKGPSVVVQHLPRQSP